MFRNHIQPAAFQPVALMLYLVPLILGALHLQPHAFAQEQGPEATVLDIESVKIELSRLAKICDQIEMPVEAQFTRDWLPPSRSDQQNLFLPTEIKSENSESKNWQYWNTAFYAARKRYAAYLFSQAELSLEKGNEQAAYRILWQVLREDATHKQARRILGPLATAVRARPETRTVALPEDRFGWQPRTYSRIRTPHFSLLTRADRRQSVQLATRLEEYYALWTQVFYPLWATPGKLKKRFEATTSTASPWKQPRDLEVVLLKDRGDYLRALGVQEKNIGRSVGYYAPNVKVAFFYPDEDMIATLFHELTHQLLAEATSVRVDENLGQAGGLWMIEGIALYMESLTRRTDFWTLGGIESPRMQTARYRGVRDGFWPQWKTFTGASMEDWKSDPQLATLYSHSAGMLHTHMDQLLDVDDSKQSLFQALIAVYQGDSDGAELLSNFGTSEELAKNRYQDALTIHDRQIAELSDAAWQAKELVLAGSILSAESWELLSSQVELEWLDVSFSNVTTEQLSWLSELKGLKRLSIEGTGVNGKVLVELARLPNLDELDLSRCAIDDKALETLRGNKTIKTLWLTSTRVTDSCLNVLASMSGLTQCDVQGTKITSQQWEKFKKSRRW